MTKARWSLLGIGAAAMLVTVAYAQAPAHDMGVMRNSSENTFVAFPGMPSCMTGAVEHGDPTKGPSVLAFKAATGCTIPWHWHTPNEHVMMVSGSAKMDMKDGGKSATLTAGGYGMMPSKHVHQFTCVAACEGFVYSDAAFDIHYVNPAGKEIPPEAALAPGKKPKK